MVASTPPAGTFEASAQTEALRPDPGLDKEDIAALRRMRREGIEPATMARTLGLDLHHVEVALAAMRTPRERPTRFTVNCGDAAYRFIRAEQAAGEPMWVTMDRLITELQTLRAPPARTRRRP